ncbi:hypothetical protein ACFC1T_09645 [Kitasatospora sp. NPDC056076]|uniref:hypothetical protein n=1 Tax=Kitasatospora sp. NPDC056076 TaxID=3345703 RepID=UPI0035DD1E48
MTPSSTPKAPPRILADQGVALVVTNRLGQILVHKDFHAPGQQVHLWRVPCAPLHGRENPLQGAVRLLAELRLNAGVDPSDLVYLFDLEGLEEPSRRLAVFAAGWSGAPHAAVRMSGSTETKWVGPNAALHLVASFTAAAVLVRYREGLPQWDRVRGITTPWSDPVLETPPPAAEATAPAAASAAPARAPLRRLGAHLGAAPAWQGPRRIERAS